MVEIALLPVVVMMKCLANRILLVTNNIMMLQPVLLWWLWWWREFSKHLVIVFSGWKVGPWFLLLPYWVISIWRNKLRGVIGLNYHKEANVGIEAHLICFWPTTTYRHPVWWLCIYTAQTSAWYPEKLLEDFLLDSTGTHCIELGVRLKILLLVKLVAFVIVLL